MKKSIFSWVEIPVLNMNRAVEFYEIVLGIKLRTLKFSNDLEMSFFPSPEGGLAGALCKHDGNYKPTVDGPLVYLTARPSIDLMIDKIKKRDGKVLKEKTLVKENTYIALFIDSEGNRVAIMEEN